jgi:hypothetical protein
MSARFKLADVKFIKHLFRRSRGVTRESYCVHEHKVWQLDSSLIKKKTDFPSGQVH